MAWVRRFVNQFRQPALDGEFDEELRFHVEARTAANRRAGMNESEAAAEARRHLGSALRAREGMREARVSGILLELGRDLRHGWRVFGRQRGLAFLVVLTLSLGIGANAAIFSLLNAMLFRPLPFAHAQRLVAVQDGVQSDGAQRTTPTIPEVLELRTASRTLDGVSFFDTRDVQINGGSEPVRALAARIEPSLFDIVGARPAIGRLLVVADSAAGASRVVLLSDGLWRRNFGADPAVIGTPLVVNGVASTIVGVTPPELSLDAFSFERIEIFLPYPMVPLYTSRDAEFANVRRVMTIARLAEGVTVDAASAELRTLADGMASRYPAIYRRPGSAPERFVMDAMPLRDVLGGGRQRVQRVLLLLLGAVVLVLLIACVNAAQFLLAQSIDREQEVALRSALGAGRSRLLRQFLSESLVLAGLAGVAGVGQALWLTRLLRRWIPATVPLVGDINVDVTVLLFTASIAVTTTIVCGLLPALRFSAVRPVAAVGVRGSNARVSTRHLLIAVEVAVSMMLVLSAGLLLRSVRDLHAVPGGYSTADVTVMRMRGMSAPDQRLGPVYRQYLERVAALPGVTAAGIASAPLAGPASEPVSIVRDAADAGATPDQAADYQMVSGGYFAALRIPLLEGRTFTDADDRTRPPVAIVNEALARRFFPGRSPIGQQIRTGPGPRLATMTIVGVVGNVRQVMQPGDEPQVYASVLQQDEPSVVLLVRAEAGRPLSEAAVKQAIWSVMPQQALFGIQTMDEIVALRTQDQRIVALLLSVFAALAVVMSAGGVYTLINYLTSRRVKELALRRAIGARAGDVFALLAGATLRWTLAGMAAGVIAAVVSSSALRAGLAGVATLDVTSVLLAVVLYFVVVGGAMSVPALRALRMDPATALRAE
jgi:putative ABC transport system permease protein